MATTNPYVRIKGNRAIALVNGQWDKFEKVNGRWVPYEFRAQATGAPSVATQNRPGFLQSLGSGLAAGAENSILGSADRAAMRKLAEITTGHAIPAETQTPFSWHTAVQSAEQNPVGTAGALIGSIGTDALPVALATLLSAGTGTGAALAASGSKLMDALRAVDSTGTLAKIAEAAKGDTAIPKALRAAGAVAKEAGKGAAVSGANQALDSYATNGQLQGVGTAAGTGAALSGGIRGAMAYLRGVRDFGPTMRAAGAGFRKNMKPITPQYAADTQVLAEVPHFLTPAQVTGLSVPSEGIASRVAGKPVTSRLRERGLAFTRMLNRAAGVGDTADASKATLESAMARTGGEIGKIVGPLHFHGRPGVIQTSPILDETGRPIFVPADRAIAHDALPAKVNENGFVSDQLPELAPLVIDGEPVEDVEGQVLDPDAIVDVLGTDASVIPQSLLRRYRRFINHGGNGQAWKNLRNALTSAAMRVGRKNRTAAATLYTMRSDLDRFAEQQMTEQGLGDQVPVLKGLRRNYADQMYLRKMQDTGRMNPTFPFYDPKTLHKLVEQDRTSNLRSLARAAHGTGVTDPYEREISPASLAVEPAVSRTQLFSSLGAPLGMGIGGLSTLALLSHYLPGGDLTGLAGAEAILGAGLGARRMAQGYFDVPLSGLERLGGKLRAAGSPVGRLATKFAITPASEKAGFFQNSPSSSESGPNGAENVLGTP